MKNARKPRGASHTRGVVLGWVIPHLAAYLTDNGFNPSPVLRLPGIRERDFDDPDVRVPDSVVWEAWRLATEITSDDALGLHVAESLPRGAFDLVEYAFRSSSTLAVGLDRLTRYGRLINDRIAARTLDMGPGFRIFLGFGAEEPVHPQRAEFALAVALRLARDATAMELAPIDVSFAHAAPQDLHEHRRFFRAPLHFGARVYAVAFRDRDGRRPLRSADKALSTIVRRRLDKALAVRDRATDASAASRVRRLMIEDMGQGATSIAVIGREMGLSSRSLSRRLLEEGTSFRTIRDAVRRDLAAALLVDPTLSVADIAFFLGYSEPAPFHRSFKRWTRQTPQAYRRKHLGG